MSEADQDANTKAQGRIVASMHANTDEKFGAMSAGIIIASIATAYFQKSFWHFVIGVVISFFASYLLRLACFRRVEQKTGLPRSIQEHFMRLYKNDKQFAAEVDSLRKSLPDNIAKGQ
ncbi:MAG: hypothetical protein IPK44_09095 [Candidatus Accumulibacter sp.]|jgi:hypothetical protein|uniref:hypothetical protein n=1 Tax=Accumulibacter sp. TaxID=2053492 RepID=UPI002588904E|nr:hypothetical protein [Accumulibacter sp.]MBK8114665.1 hypothetical protein [Accumulibacter sp.]